MSDLQPYVISVVRGATLFREIAVLDSDRAPVDVTGANKSIQISEGILEADVAVTQGAAGDNYIEMRADGTDTVSWPLGAYKFRIWLDWGESADVEDEVIFSGTISVEDAL